MAADGSGDFATVQGAIDFVPTANAVRRLIFIRRGFYQELVHVSNKPLLTLHGEDRRETIIAYANNAVFNPSPRAAVGIDAADTTLENLTVRNLTPKGGSQAEAVRASAARFQLRECDLYSFQDTLQLNGSAYVDSSYVEGTSTSCGHGCRLLPELGAAHITSNGFYVQARTAQNQPWFVYVTRGSAAAGVTGTWLART